MICSICNTHTTTDMIDDKTYHFCRLCDFIWLDEANRILLDEEKKRYSFHENTADNEGYVKMFETFLDEVIPYHKEPFQHALDYGCGPGPVLAQLLEKRGMSVDVYDPHFSPERVYEKKKYDLITLTEVLEHLSSPCMTLKTIRAYLKENGIIACMTLFHPTDRKAFRTWWYHRDPTHISFFTPQTLGKLAERIDMKGICVNNKNSYIFSL